MPFYHCVITIKGDHDKLFRSEPELYKYTNKALEFLLGHKISSIKDA